MEHCNTCQHWRPDGQKTIGNCSLWSTVRSENGAVTYTEPFECGGNFGCTAHAERTRLHISSFEFGELRC